MDKQLSVLEKQFDASLNQASPVVDDVVLRVVYDKSGDPVVVQEKVDYRSVIESNGKVDDWSLGALLRAGIDPEFGINTGDNSRLETSKSVKAFADAISAEVNKSE